MKQITAHNETFEVISEGTFLEAVKSLQDKKADAIYGPQGGMLTLDKNECLVYLYPTPSHKHIYFSATNYLGVWEILKRIREV